MGAGCEIGIVGELGVRRYLLLVFRLLFSPFESLFFFLLSESGGGLRVF